MPFSFSTRSPPASGLVAGTNLDATLSKDHQRKPNRRWRDLRSDRLQQFRARSPPATRHDEEVVVHYAFDAWMTREYPGVRFERFADDVVVHCVTERQARNLVAAIGDRMEQVGLRLHPDKTKIVYCKDQRRRLDYGLTAFTFLGFTFRTRTARGKSGALFASFQPAISNDARDKVSGEIRRWRLHRRIGLTLADIAQWINPIVRGWMQYYGAFYRSAMYPLLSRINAYLMEEGPGGPPEV
jgi:hypothetical protein